MKEHLRVIINDLRSKLVNIRQMKTKLNKDNAKDRRMLHKLETQYKETLDMFILYSMKRFNMNIRKVG